MTSERERKGRRTGSIRNQYSSFAALESPMKSTGVEMRYSGIGTGGADVVEPAPQN
jgi:hypothetical protein